MIFKYNSQRLNNKVDSRQVTWEYSNFLKDYGSGFTNGPSASNCMKTSDNESPNSQCFLKIFYTFFLEFFLQSASHFLRIGWLNLPCNNITFGKVKIPAYLDKSKGIPHCDNQPSSSLIVRYLSFWCCNVDEWLGTHVSFSLTHLRQIHKTI